MRTLVLVGLIGCADGSSESSGQPEPTPVTDHCVLPPAELPIHASTQRTIETFQALPIHTYIPDEPRAILWYFHSAGQTAEEVDALEQVALRNLLTDGGWGFVSTASVDRQAGLWDVGSEDPEDNLDLRRLSNLRDDLIVRTGWTADTPMVMAGFGGGATAAVHTGVVMSRDHEWPVVALSLHDSAITTASALAIELPTFLTHNEHAASDIRTAMGGLFDSLSGLGVSTEFAESSETPLSPTRFMRIPEFPEARSRNDYEELVTLGWIDGTGRRILDFDIEDRSKVDQVMEQWRQSSEDPGVDDAIGQLRVVWATHSFNASFADQECAFLEEALAAPR